MPDSLGMRDAVFGLPEQLAAATRRLSVTGALPAHDDVANVLIIGTGAAGWVGDLVAAVAGPFMPVPLAVHKGFEPPSFVDATTLVVAISASGDSPETVASASMCLEAGARLFAVTSGGRLGALADANEAPTVFLPVADAPIPTRTRVGALAVPVLDAFDALGFYPGSRDWIAAAVDQLRTRADALRAEESLATRLASSLVGTMPIIYGGGSLGGVAAQRWKTQLNQTAKTPAWTGELPDVVHGEVAGWGQHGDITRQVMSLVLLRHDDEAPEIAEQFTTVDTWTDEVMARVLTVDAEGEGRLAQLLDLAMIADVTALDLADRAGIDPGPTPAIATSPAALTS